MSPPGREYIPSLLSSLAFNFAQLPTDIGIDRTLLFILQPSALSLQPFLSKFCINPPNLLLTLQTKSYSITIALYNPWCFNTN